MTDFWHGKLWSPTKHALDAHKKNDLNKENGLGFSTATFFSLKKERKYMMFRIS